MVIMEQCDLKQLHLRPVVSPKAKTLLGGPWIIHFWPQDSLLRFYCPPVKGFDQNRAVLADEFDVTEIREARPSWYLLYGYLTYGSIGNVEKGTLISLKPYTDEEVAEAILFRTQIAYLIENVRSFWQVLAETAAHGKK